MESKEYYNQAVKWMENIKKAEPQLFFDSNSQLCVLTTADKQNLYAGVTSVKIHKGQVMRSCPEYNAIMAMLAAGEHVVDKLITISFHSKEVSQPCEACLKLLYHAAAENKDTEIYVSSSQSMKAAEMLHPTSAENAPPVKSGAETTAADGFAAALTADAPPPVMNKTSKNPLPSANDFSSFAANGAMGDFGFEAADPVEEESENEFEEKAAANTDNPFYAPPTMQSGTAAVMPNGQPQPAGAYVQPPPQPYGYPQQQSYGYPPQQPQYGFAQQQSQYGFVQQQPQYGFMQQQQSVYMQQGQPQQSLYAQPPQQQNMYSQPYMPNARQSTYINQAAHSQNVSAYYSQPVSTGKSDGAMFKNRLANFMDDEPAGGSNSQEEKNLSRAEMLKQAKEKKKMAKMDADYKKQTKKRGFN